MSTASRETIAGIPIPDSALAREAVVSADPRTGFKRGIVAAFY